MDKKLCNKCMQLLPLDNFHKSKSAKSGRTAYCKLCVKVYSDKYTHDNRLYINEQSRKYQSLHRNTLNYTVSALFSAAKTRSKLKNLDFELDREWITEKVQPMVCTVTDLILQLEIDDRYQYSPFRPSIDRIDNTKGYTKSNCQITSVIYNRAKSEYTHADVLLMCKHLIDKTSTK